MIPQTTLKHVPVLSNEVLSFLDIKPAGKYLDGTCGLGGHSKQILSKLVNITNILMERSMTKSGIVLISEYLSKAGLTQSAQIQIIYSFTKFDKGNSEILVKF